LRNKGFWVFQFPHTGIPGRRFAAGIWTVLISENEYGHPQYGLEYYATEQFGENVRDLAVMHWDHDREQLTGD
jgi:hypothetical protein